MSSSTSTFIRTQHDPRWSGEEHTIARDQFSRYGKCFVDDFGRPIDDPEGVACLAEADEEGGNYERVA